MKIQRGLTFLVLGFLFSLMAMTQTWALARDERVEVPLDNLFAPSHGFDDNDHVEVVVTGTFPNGCFTKGDVFVDFLDDGIGIGVHQYALKSIDGVCADAEHMPAHLRVPVPFTNVIPVGRLNAASYQLIYLGRDQKTIKKLLEIENAPVAEVDTLPYAAVTEIDSSDIVVGSEVFEVTLRGVLYSSCTMVESNVQVVRPSPDVFVLLPTLKLIPGAACLPTRRPFTLKTKLGRLPLGQYLIHVRAMSGTGLNKVVQVVGR